MLPYLSNGKTFLTLPGGVLKSSKDNKMLCVYLTTFDTGQQKEFIEKALELKAIRPVRIAKRNKDDLIQPKRYKILTGWYLAGGGVFRISSRPPTSVP